MHGVAFGGAGLVNDALEEAADGGVGERALIGGLGILQHFLFAFRLIKREVGRLFEPANFEGTTRALVQELDELLVDFVDAAAPVVEIHDAASDRKRKQIPRSEKTFGAQKARCARNDKRSEEHTSELQSLAYLVCRLLLEKKKKKKK